MFQKIHNMLPVFNMNSFGWNQLIQNIKIVQSISSQGIVQNVISNITFRGIIQPLAVEKLEITLSAERSWEPLSIHTATNLKLLNNDRIIYNNVQYKIIGIFPANQAYGFFEYHLIKDYDTTSKIV